MTAYNYMDDGYICCNSTSPSIGADRWQEIGLNNFTWLAGTTCVRGPLGLYMDSDATHGNAIYSTYFRNWSTEYRSRFTNPFDGATIDDINALQARRKPTASRGSYNLHVLAFLYRQCPRDPGAMSGWVYHARDFTRHAAVFLLGYTDDQRYPHRTHDLKADFTFSSPPGTTIAHGNYDFLNNAISWDPNNDDHALPNSLYLTQKPAFFIAGSGYAWPWGSAGSPQLYTLPAKARYDAGTPFAQP